MGWTRHDDRRPFTAKMAGLSDAAYRLDDELLSWCAANGTDGRIAARLMPTISPRSARRRVVNELVERGRLHRAGDAHCDHPRCPQPGPDGYSVHDYLQYNPSAEEAAAGKAANRDRVAKWRDRNALPEPLRTPYETPDERSTLGVSNGFPRVDPDPDPLVVDLGGDLTLSRGSADPPPSTCKDHPEGSAGPCGACADARRRRAAFDAETGAEQRKQAALELSRQAKARAEASAHAIAACHLCDERGYRGGQVCDHDPSTAQRAQRGAAAVRAALSATPPKDAA